MGIGSVGSRSDAVISGTNVVVSQTSLARAMSKRMSIDGVTYKIASCREEREDAFKLIHDVYSKSGLMQRNAAGIRVTPYHFHPTTNLFVAYHGQQLIYTMTLISDDDMGMPLDTVFGPEVDLLRSSSNAYFAEVSCLACHVGYFSRARMFNVFVHLAGLMVQSARENGIEKLVIACNPRHARFYKGFLGFSQISEQRDYAQVMNQPAVACEHDFVKLDRETYPLHQRIYSPQFRHWELYHQPMLREEKEYFTEKGELYCENYPLAAVT